MTLPLFQTLYARLAIGLFLLLVIVGGLFTALSLYSVREYSAAVSQELNRDLARHLVSDRNLVTDGKINHSELERLFDLYMSINPSIEIYLLDQTGRILSYSADPAKIKRKHVSLEPVHELLENPDAYPLQGDDPRSHDRGKVFSVTPIPSAENTAGYLYVVLRGEEYDFAESMVHSDRLLQMGGGALAISLFVGLLAGLVFFRLLTRRLSRLTARVEAFEAEAKGAVTTGGAHETGVPGDDVDYLSARFDQMAARIAAQLELLKDKDRQRRQLVAQVSHDLRTPLASIQGYLETLAMVLADIAMTERVLDNLIGNAVDHSPKGAEVKLSVAAGNEGVEICVLDAGEGINPQDIDHVFDPFYQAPGAIRTGHAGLGLAIARRMAELQQGRVSVESQPGSGAAFRFWLPQAAATANESTEL